MLATISVHPAYEVWLLLHLIALLPASLLLCYHHRAQWSRRGVLIAAAVVVLLVWHTWDGLMAFVTFGFLELFLSWWPRCLVSLAVTFGTSALLAWLWLRWDPVPTRKAAALAEDAARAGPRAADR